jgi:hypothetical protein
MLTSQNIDLRWIVLATIVESGICRFGGLGCIFLQKSSGFLFFSVPLALFPQESGFLFRRNCFTPAGILSVPGLPRKLRRP